MQVNFTYWLFILFKILFSDETIKSEMPIRTYLIKLFSMKKTCFKNLLQCNVSAHT